VKEETREVITIGGVEAEVRPGQLDRDTAVRVGEWAASRWKALIDFPMEIDLGITVVCTSAKIRDDGRVDVKYTLNADDPDNRSEFAFTLPRVDKASVLPLVRDDMRRAILWALTTAAERAKK